MEGSPEMPTPAPNPTSWRDVYTLVQDVETRLTKRMDEIALAATTVANDHEVRIRVLERTDLSADVRNKTVVSTISLGRSTLLTIMSIGSMLVAVVALFAK